MTISALQHRLTHSALLADELSSHRRREVGAIRSGLDLFTKGAWSLPEAALARVLEADPTLPRFVLNTSLWTVDQVRIGCPDAYFPDSGVAVQVHSRAHHSGLDADGLDRWTATVEKDARLVEHGVIVVPITPRSIERRPDQVVHRLKQAVAVNAGRDMSHVLLHKP